MKRDVCLFRRSIGVALMLMLTMGIIPGVLAQDKTQDIGKDRNERKKKKS